MINWVAWCFYFLFFLTLIQCAALDFLTTFWFLPVAMLRLVLCRQFFILPNKVGDYWSWFVYLFKLIMEICSSACAMAARCFDFINYKNMHQGHWRSIEFTEPTSNNCTAVAFANGITLTPGTCSVQLRSLDVADIMNLQIHNQKQCGLKVVPTRDYYNLQTAKCSGSTRKACYRLLFHSAKLDKI